MEAKSLWPEAVDALGRRIDAITRRGGMSPSASGRSRGHVDLSGSQSKKASRSDRLTALVALHRRLTTSGEEVG
jgi:hypothetical protein